MATVTELVGRELVVQLAKLFGSAIVVLLVYVASKIAYVLYVDERRHVPGPWLNAVTMIPYARHLMAGTTVQNTVDLHKKYGKAVRVSPNEVSFISGDTAFPDIYGFRIGNLKGHRNMEKDPVWYVKPSNGSPSLLHTNDEDHQRMRRVVSHAFSDKALLAHEPLIHDYVNQLVAHLKEATTSSNSATTDMTKWYKWTMFDIIADLAFGEPFGCLEDHSTHQYISLLEKSLASLRMSYIATYFPWLKYLGSYVIDKSLLQKRKDYLTWISTKVKRRIERKPSRPDFMTFILANNGAKEAQLSQAEITSNASSLIIGGSETTSTLLTAVTWLLLTNPDKLQKLKDEIRSKFRAYDDITISAVNETPYLIAVVSEGLRYFPPLPVGFPRRVPEGGEYVSGIFVPEGTVISVSHYAAYHSEQNFKDPDSFVPERWLGIEAYAGDKRTACQPFSFGPRACLGRTLAYSEMRVILAKLIWSFDFELDERGKDWLKHCRVMRHWVKPELPVKVTEVVRHRSP